MPQSCSMADERHRRRCVSAASDLAEGSQQSQTALRDRLLRVFNGPVNLEFMPLPQPLTRDAHPQRAVEGEELR